jgi:hypothetical protein
MKGFVKLTKYLREEKENFRQRSLFKNKKSAGTRADLLHLARALGLKGNGVEIGVAEGDFSELILCKTQLSVLYSIDSWKSFGGTDYVDVNNVDDHENENRYRRVLKRFSSYGSRSCVMRKASEQAAPLFQSSSLDFIYIDANHSYEACKKDLELWWPKLRKGGMFSGHDYLDGQLSAGNFGVKRAVDEFFKAVSLSGDFFTTNESDWPSWYFIKAV